MNNDSDYHVIEPKARFFLLVLLGIMSIGLTIYDAPRIYSQPDPDEVDETDGEEADEGDEVNEDDDADEVSEAAKVDEEEVLDAKIVEICDNNLDDDGDDD